MDNKFCVNCGNALNENEKFCGKCGRGIVQNNSINNIVNTNTPMPIILGVSSLVLYFIGGIASFLAIIFVDSFDGISVIFDLIVMSPFLGIIIMIIGRIMYSKNTFLKIVMWIIIGFVIASIALVVLFIAIVLYFVMFRGLRV